MGAVVHQRLVDPVLSLRQVQEAVGYSPSQIYRLIAKGDFPDRIRLGPGRVGWRASSISTWLDDRPFGMQTLARTGAEV